MFESLNYFIEDTIDRRLPFYQRGEEDLIDYLGVAGSFLDDFRKSIQNIRNARDYEYVQSNNVRNLAKHYGLELPRNLEEDITRITIRDIVDIYRTNGTERTLKWVFGVIGWRVDIRYAWMINPEDYDPSSKEENERFDLSKFVFGESQIDSDGVYFYGEDLFGNALNKIRIIGENYSPSSYRSPDWAMLTSYLFIEINQEDYNIFIEDEYDPDTGETYSYTESEIFEITRELIDVMLYEKVRPVNVSIAIIANSQTYSDNIEENYQLLDDGEDLTTIEAESQSLKYSHGGAYGVAMDLHILGDAYGNYQYTDESPNGTWYWFDPPEETITRKYFSGKSGSQRRIPLRLKSSLDISVGSNDTVEIYVTEDNRKSVTEGSAIWTLLETINNVSNYRVEFQGYYYFYINIPNSLEENVDATITHRKVNYVN